MFLQARKQAFQLLFLSFAIVLVPSSLQCVLVYALRGCLARREDRDVDSSMLVLDVRGNMDHLFAISSAQIES